MLLVNCSTALEKGCIKLNPNVKKWYKDEEIGDERNLKNHVPILHKEYGDELQGWTLFKKFLKLVYCRAESPE